ncbi:translation initiation factor IF-5A [Candidatus Woesearchaeota archaeon]|nr:translation initiation factor IF-5A [Candidatus Woesearchaeota archaeon]
MGEGETKQTTAGALKIGSYVVFDNTACIVKSIQTSKTGKHGHAKCRIEAIGVVDDKKIIKIMPGEENVEVPIIDKKNAQVLSVHDNVANVMDTDTYETFDIKIPEEFKSEVIEGVQVLYWTVLGDKMIKQVKK